MDAASTPPPPATPPAPPELSRDPRTGWVMLAVLVPVGGWLVWEIQRTIGLSSPRLWELLRTDRVFGLAMLDFVVTAAWGMLVLIERARGGSRWLWVALAIFVAVPSLGIALYLLIDRRGRDKPSAPPIPERTGR